MHTLIYDGTFESFLCAVFDVYYYKFSEPFITTEKDFKGNIYQQIHQVQTIEKNHDRIWKGLQKKLSNDSVQQFYKTFLSELPSIENTLLQYAQYVFDSDKNIEKDYSHAAVLIVFQTAKKVHREKHRMEAFVRFQETADHLFFCYSGTGL
jgi:probable DNA metabolism protein